jgi:hypothetical protein
MDVSLIESARQTDEGSPELETDLAESYHAAISQARRLAIGLLSLEWPKIEFRYLLSLLASLHGHGVMGFLVFNLDCLCGRCPKCDELVYPEEIHESGYVKP